MLFPLPNFFCILHVKLLQTNDERPYTQDTRIQESETLQTKAIVSASGSRLEGRHEETALSGDLFSVRGFDRREQLGLGEGRMTDALLYRAVICL